MTDPLGLLVRPGELDINAVAGDLGVLLDAHSVVFLRTEADRLRAVGTWPQVQGIAAESTLSTTEGVVGVVASVAQVRVMPSDSPRNAWFRRLSQLGPDQALPRIVAPARDLNGRVRGIISVFRRRPFRDSEATHLQAVADAWGLRLYTTELRDADRDRRTERDMQIAQAVASEENERRRLAYDLHDGVATALASASFHLASADLTLGSTADREHCLTTARTQLSTARSLVDLAYDQTRSAITGLHSLVLSDLGLVAAIESLAKATPGVTVQIMTDPPELFADIPAHTSAALHRIAAETLRNVAKHAQAQTAMVSLRRAGDVVLLGCSDDGVGFDLVGPRADGRGHYGLTSMAERCALIDATLHIESQPGLGTTIVVEAPV